MSTEGLEDALRIFVKESCDFLNRQPRTFREWIRVVRQNDGSTSFPTEIRRDFSDALLRLQMQELENPSPAFDHCLDVVRQDPQLREVLLVDAAGKPIENDKMERWWVSTKLAGSFMRIYIDQDREIKFDDRVFDDCFEKFKCHIESSDINIIELSPLMSTDIESDQVMIGSGVLLRRLRSDEIENWLNGDRYPLAQTHPLTPSELVDLKCAIEVEYNQDRFSPIGSKPEPREMLQRLLTAIRLVTDASPRLAFTKTRAFSIPLFGFDSTSWGLSFQRQWSFTKINKNQEQEIVELYRKLGSNTNRDRVSLALSRWNSASDKLTDEDKLIDYWIALESLYVPETAQELSFRAALRIAAFLGLDGTERQTIYDEMRDSYRLRSEIVHGSLNKNKKKTASVELVKITRSFLRRTLLKIVESGEAFDPTKLESQLLALDVSSKKTEETHAST